MFTLHGEPDHAIQLEISGAINYLEEMKVTGKSSNSSLKFGKTIEPAGDIFMNEMS
jgi:hypothetical protein